MLVIAAFGILAATQGSNWLMDINQRKDMSERLVRLEEAVRFGPIELSAKVNELGWTLGRVESDVSEMRGGMREMRHTLRELSVHLNRIEEENAYPVPSLP